MTRWALWLALCAVPGCYQAHYVDELEDAGEPAPDAAIQETWCLVPAPPDRAECYCGAELCTFAASRYGGVCELRPDVGFVRPCP